MLNTNKSNRDLSFKLSNLNFNNLTSTSNFSDDVYSLPIIYPYSNSNKIINPESFKNVYHNDNYLIIYILVIIIIIIFIIKK